MPLATPAHICWVFSFGALFSLPACTANTERADRAKVTEMNRRSEFFYKNKAINNYFLFSLPACTANTERAGGSPLPRDLCKRLPAAGILLLQHLVFRDLFTRLPAAALLPTSPAAAQQPPRRWCFLFFFVFLLVFLLSFFVSPLPHPSSWQSIFFFVYPPHSSACQSNFFVSFLYCIPSPFFCVSEELRIVGAAMKIVLRVLIWCALCVLRVPGVHCVFAGCIHTNAHT